MKTSWHETRQIDEHLAGNMHNGDALLFEAKLLLDPELQDKSLRFVVGEVVLFPDQVRLMRCSSRR